MIAVRTEGRFLGIYGEPRVNVLLLNLDLVKENQSHAEAEQRHPSRA
jgi:hypothetical protein